MFNSKIKLILKQNWLLFACLLLLTLIRIPSFFDFWYYGDENIYLAIGDGILKGQYMYLDIWDSKPPMLFIVYAINSFFFGPNIATLRLINLLLTFIGIYSFSLLSKKLLKKKLAQDISLVAFTLCWTFSFESHLLNGENIFVPMILAGIVTMLSKNNFVKWISPFFFAIAVYTKFHASIEIMTLVVLFFLITNVEFQSNDILKNIKLVLKSLWIQLKQNLIFLIWTFSLIFTPWIITISMFWNKAGLAGLQRLQFSIFGFSSTYLSSLKANFLGYPYPILSLRFRMIMVVLGIVLFSYLYLSNRINKITFFVIIWTMMCLFLSFLSDRNYSHYLLQITTPFSIIFGYLIYYIVKSNDNWNQKIINFLGFCCLVQAVLYSFANGPFVGYNSHPLREGFVQNLLIERNVEKYQRSLYDEKFTRQQLLIDVINNYSKNNDFVFTTDTSFEIYALTKRRVGNEQLYDFQIILTPEQAVDKLEFNKTSLIINDYTSPTYNYYNDELKKRNTFEKFETLFMNRDGFKYKFDLWKLK
ncbi:MAG: hypothetical protein ACRCXZ_05320 [Patescibacteria group bacterium]